MYESYSTWGKIHKKPEKCEFTRFLFSSELVHKSNEDFPLPCSFAGGLDHETKAMMGHDDP